MESELLKNNMNFNLFSERKLLIKFTNLIESEIWESRNVN